MKDHSSPKIRQMIKKWKIKLKKLTYLKFTGKRCSHLPHWPRNTHGSKEFFIVLFLSTSVSAFVFFKLCHFEFVAKTLSLLLQQQDNRSRGNVLLIIKTSLLYERMSQGVKSSQFHTSVELWELGFWNFTWVFPFFQCFG